MLEVVENDLVFSSISTFEGLVPHKQTPTFSQRSSQLSVLFLAGSTYTMTARCITQRCLPAPHAERILVAC